METTLAANAREHGRGKSDARKVRKGGRLPGVLYGPGKTGLAIDVDPHGLVELFRKAHDRNTVVELALDGRKVKCLVREVQRHPLTRELLHVDFYEVEAGRKVVVEIPVTTIGKAAGLAVGGRVQIIRRSLNVRCDPGQIPKVLEIDVTGMEVGQSVKVSEVRPPQGVDVLWDQDFPVITIAGKQKERVEDLAPAAAAPAEGEAAPAAEGAEKAEGKAPEKGDHKKDKH
jgi:large subunit ribosomal protein L25